MTDFVIISAKKVLELNKKYRLIENLSKRESNPEGVGIDLRVGEVYKLGGGGFLGVDERKTPEIKKIADVKKGKKRFVLKAHTYVLIKTMERVNAPTEKVVLEKGKKPVHVTYHIYPRTTLHRSGILLIATKGDPGYSGELTFGLTNLSNDDFEFELGARVANVVFTEVHGELSRPYGGQWRGGKVGTKGFERQI